MRTTLLLLFFLLSGVDGNAGTDKYRLMFNSDPATSITIGWEQVSGNSPSVYFGTIDHGTSWVSYANVHDADRQVYYMGMDNRFARLTGLTPNTIYYFVIKDSQGVSARYWFKTCPGDNDHTLSFISGGDSRSGQTQRRNSNRMVAKIRPHAVLFGGDLVDVPSNGSVQTWFDDWQLATTSDGQMIPLVHSFGNHEEFGTGGPNFIHDLFDTPYDVFYNVRFGGDLFSLYTLNGEVYPGHTISNASVRANQNAWLQSSLSTDSSIWKTAQYHRPIVPHYSNKGEGYDEYSDWANLFYNSGVRLVMESDAHVVKMTEEVRPVYNGSPSGSSSNWFTTSGIAPDKGITFIGEGNWGTIRVPDDTHPMTVASASFYSFNWLLVDKCKIDIRAVDTQNPNSVPEHAPGDYTSISAGLDAQIWKPNNIQSGVKSIVKCTTPLVDFTANQTNIFVGDSIDFTDVTGNVPSSWSWDFGDGGTSSNQNPTHQYNSVGTYTVSLTCGNGLGSDVEIKTGYITVSLPVAPTADFSVNNNYVVPGQQIVFTDLSVGIPDTWLWDFGDGSGTSTLQNPIYSYSTPGAYTVKLMASNSNGTDDEIKWGHIIVINESSVIATVTSGNNDAEEDRSNQTVDLTGSVLEIGNSNGDDQLMAVRFQNVTVPQGASITNAFIRMRADVDDGFNSQLNIYINVEDVDSSAEFLNVNANISNRTLSGSQFTWANGTVQGWEAGSIYDTPDLAALLQEIVNRPGWVSGNPMTFVYWSDLNESSEREPDSFEGGWPAELHFSYIIYPPVPPDASFTSSATTICEGASVNFTDNSSNGPTQWNWTVSGPEILTSTSQNPTFSFALPGIYDVEMVAMNAGGADIQTSNSYVIVSSAPTMTSSGSLPICQGDSTSLSVSGATSYLWDNGLGYGPSHIVSPISTTTYNVIGISASGCQSTEQLTVTVNPQPTISFGTIIDPSTCNPSAGSIEITGSGTGDISWSGPSSGSASGTTLPYVISGLVEGSYTVSLTDPNGCSSDIINSTINNTVLTTPMISASGSLSICNGDSVTLTSSLGSGNVWSNGETTQSISVGSSGTFTVTYTDSVGCSSSSAPITVAVNPVPNPPIITPSGTVTICEGDSVILESSELIGNVWSTADTSQNIVVQSAGTYSVVYTDGNGCQSSSSTQVTIDSLPVVTLSPFLDNFCETDGVFALTTGSPQGGAYSGNGVINGEFDPSAAGVGSHVITYSLQGSNGCVGSSQQTINVDDCAAVEGLEKFGYKVYPNPADELLFIERGDNASRATIKIYDEKGKLIWNAEVSDNPVAIDIRGWSSGVYQVYVFVEGNKAVEKIIIK